MEIRRPRPVAFAALLAVAGVFDSRADDQPAREAPQVLPPVRVNAPCPLVKVAQYHMREERYAPAVIADGEWLYIFGGSNSANTALESVERFNIRTHQVEPWGELNTGRRWHRAVLRGRQVYVLGGSIGWQREVGEDFISSVEIFDLDRKRATRGPEMPDNRGNFGCVLLDEKIYVVGGNHVDRGRKTFTNTVLVLDLATNRWSNGVPMPTPRATYADVVTGVLVTAGGYNGSHALPDVEAFNPRTQTWNVLPPLGQPVSGHSMVFLDHYLFLFGDYDSLDQITAYDLKDKSSAVYNLGYNSARHTSATVLDGQIYIVGGKLDFPSALDYIQVFALRGKP